MNTDAVAVVLQFLPGGTDVPTRARFLATARVGRAWREAHQVLAERGHGPAPLRRSPRVDWFSSYPRASFSSGAEALRWAVRCAGIVGAAESAEFVARCVPDFALLDALTPRQRRAKESVALPTRIALLVAAATGGNVAVMDGLGQPPYALGTDKTCENARCAALLGAVERCSTGSLRRLAEPPFSLGARHLQRLKAKGTPAHALRRAVSTGCLELWDTLTATPYAYAPSADAVVELLVVAASHGQAGMLDRLGTYGRGPLCGYKRNQIVYRMLCGAASGGHWHVVERMAKPPFSAADTNQQVEGWARVLCCAAAAGHVAVVDRLARAPYNLRYDHAVLRVRSLDANVIPHAYGTWCTNAYEVAREHKHIMVLARLFTPPYVC